MTLQNNLDSNFKHLCRICPQKEISSKVTQIQNVYGLQGNLLVFRRFWRELGGSSGGQNCLSFQCEALHVMHTSGDFRNHG